MSVHQTPDGGWPAKHYVGKTAEGKPVAIRHAEGG